MELSKMESGFDLPMCSTKIGRLNLALRVIDAVRKWDFAYVAHKQVKTKMSNYLYYGTMDPPARVDKNTQITSSGVYASKAPAQPALKPESPLCR